MYDSGNPMTRAVLSIPASPAAIRALSNTIPYFFVGHCGAESVGRWRGQGQGDCLPVPWSGRDRKAVKGYVKQYACPGMRASAQIAP